MKTQIGHYLLLSELGRGGMGVVYKAYEPALERYIAVKELAVSLSHDADLVERFLREARAMAALNDPHIIQIHAIGQEAEPPYFAMEFIEGESLSSLLEREGPLKVSDALKICQQAARGLSAAHAQGVIHRDIKPSNLMLNKRGQVKIADFGIAFTQRDASKKLTSTGDVVGTPGYLSPEVCLGNPVDARSDLFALGIVLYEMLGKRLPFDDPSPLKLMLSVVEAEVPDIRKINREIDDHTVAILDKLLAKNPDDRFQSADDLLAELEKHPAVAQPALSIQAHLPSGAASTLLQTPGLAKAVSASLPTQVTPSANRVIDAEHQKPKRNFFWLVPVLAVAVILSWLWLSQKNKPEILDATSQNSAPASTSIPETRPADTANPPVPPVNTTEATAPITKPAETAPAKQSPATITEPALATETKPVAKPKPATMPPLQPMQKYGEVYLGPQNEEVSVAQVDGEDIAYLKATGINSSYDGKVIKTVPRPGPFNGKDYAIQHNGGDYVVLVIRNRTDRSKSIELYLPGLNGEIKLSYDGALSKQLNTNALRDEYLNQKP
jgi:serine/threonine protein kinase